MKRVIQTTFMVCTVALALSAFAESQPVTVNTVAEKEERYTDEAGVERSRLVPVATVIPGDQVVYTITFANQGDQAADGIRVVDPIPEAMRYVDGSAFGPGTTITFSADGGTTFAPRDNVMVSNDGAERVASADEYTHIQWVFNHPLEPNAQAYAQFKAVLK